MSTHGFLENDIKVWGGNGLEPVGRLKGHSARILYSALSPCGKHLITGSSEEESLRFWDVFPGKHIALEQSLPTIR